MKTYNEISVGDSATNSRTLTNQDILDFAKASGDMNPAHLDAEYAATTIFKKPIAHGMWGASLISAVLGNQLPGPGAIYVNQTLSFKQPVYVGDTITVVVTVVSKSDERKIAQLDTVATNQNGRIVIKGVATAMLLS